jgi:hypothetical protein
VKEKTRKALTEVGLLLVYREKPVRRYNKQNNRKKNSLREANYRKNKQGHAGMEYFIWWLLFSVFTLEEKKCIK